MTEPTYISDDEFKELLGKVNPQDIVLMHQVLTINCQSKATSRNDDHAQKGVESNITNKNKLVCKPFNFGLILAAVYILGVISAFMLSLCKMCICRFPRRKGRKKSKGLELIVKNQQSDEKFGEKRNPLLSIEEGKEKKNFWK